MRVIAPGDKKRQVASREKRIAEKRLEDKR